MSNCLMCSDPIKGDYKEFCEKCLISCIKGMIEQVYMSKALYNDLVLFIGEFSDKNVIKK